MSLSPRRFDCRLLLRHPRRPYSARHAGDRSQRAGCGRKRFSRQSIEYADLVENYPIPKHATVFRGHRNP